VQERVDDQQAVEIPAVLQVLPQGMRAVADDGRVEELELSSDVSLDRRPRWILARPAAERQLARPRATPIAASALS
jgi:hypothetical protein